MESIAKYNTNMLNALKWDFIKQNPCLREKRMVWEQGFLNLLEQSISPSVYCTFPILSLGGREAERL